MLRDPHGDCHTTHVHILCCLNTPRTRTWHNYIDMVLHSCIQPATEIFCVCSASFFAIVALFVQNRQPQFGLNRVQIAVKVNVAYLCLVACKRT